MHLSVALGFWAENNFFLNFDPIKEIPNGVYLTGFFSNTPTQKIIDKIFELANLRDAIARIILRSFIS